MSTSTSSLRSGDAQQLLDKAITAIAALEAVRDESGQIIDFRYTIVNQQVEQWSGLSASQIEGQRLLTLFPGTKRSGLFDRWVRVVETGEPIRFQEHYREGQTDVWYDTQAVRQGDGLIESFSDITTLKAAELSRQQDTDQLQQLIDTLPSMLAISEAVRDEEGRVIDFRVLSANQAALALFNRTPDQLINKLVSEVFPYDQHNGVFAGYVHTVTTGEPQQLEVPIDTPKGREWFDIRIKLLSPERLSVSALNITQLKEAQLLNQHQADTLWQVMNTAPTAIVQHDAIRDEQGNIIDFRMTMINQVAADWLGGSPDAFTNTPLSARFPGVQQTSVFTRYCRVIETGEPTRFERLLNGIWYDFSVAKSGDGCLVVAIDVTQNHQQRQKLAATNTELIRSNDNLAQFAYVASHDLQEPLRKIQSFGDVLNNQFGHQLSHDGLDLLLRMQAAANRMSLLIKDLLDYSRISTHKDSFGQLSLDKLVQEALDDLYVVIEETKAVIDVPSLPTITGDYRQIKQLLQNLLSNALKFHKPDQPPHIVIRTQRITRAQLPTHATITSQASHFQEITVQDNGIGFDSKFADRIFQVFQRLHGRSKYPGTGVGLAICRKVAENHGGTITVKSETNQGSTFRLYLPESDVA
ncbi:PAS/PAC sensor signal transduction histidine kinase [Fibrella aestuarina BUZ 2]|uniref:histidine kinase n=1 Tax=Fibrella aestuarina BUZ 2 TaxID=1166018 RepID=I0K8P1_9BACT|nr:PAS domain-containing protein [Fibrella aestuarina]CCH00494.1 PAS/PAC sensor signal transduction histidine kinase [Fibrella aestuarina BUZ 2]